MFSRHTSKSRVAARLSTLLACALTLSALPFSAPGSAHASASGDGGRKRVESVQIPNIPPGQAYKLTTLVSDSPGLAPVQDPLLVNPWGISNTATSPFWFANNGSSTTQLFRGDVGGAPFFFQIAMPTVTIPEPPPSITGTVANNGGTTDFVITSGSASARANFLFASLSGKIYGWSPNVPAAGSTVATQAASQPGHVYTGLAIGNNGSANFLYAADFANGKIDVFNGSFALQPAASFPFNDPTIPTSPASNTYHPFNIQNIGGSLYVTYAKVDPATGRSQNGAGFGFVSKFDTNGAFLGRLVSNGPLDAPWGITIAPASFGTFGNALLVGNFSDEGHINAFNPTTGAFLGTLQDEAGEPVEIDELWALAFGNGAATDANTLYFTSGIGEENHGLVGKLNPTTATATSLIQFGADSVEIGEGDGGITITVTRAGNVTGPATVNYATFDEDRPDNIQPGHANQKSDYEIATGVLRFSAGETSKTFRIPLVDDRFFEGDEDFEIYLTNPTGAGVGLGDPHVMDVVIHDNDSAPPAPTATTRAATGANAAAIQSAVDTFRADLGPLNANVGGSFANGRREINWDGVPDASSEPNNLPANFFNVNSPRGVILAPASGGNLRVSMDDDTGGDADPDQLRFSDLNAQYLTEFSAFSQQRIFGVQGGANTVDVTFFVPGTATPATVSGFGSVFTDVDSAVSTRLEYFDAFGQLITSQAVQPAAGSGGLSFAGISFSNRRIARVRITSGSAQLGAVDVDTPTGDAVAMDDFIYGEPQALPAGTNPIDTPGFFVRQHYLDFLNREPDTAGFNAWVATLNNCAAGNTSCDRIAVSANFFRSDEYQARGFYATRFYRAAFGRDPLFGEFMGDLSRLSGATPEETAALKTTFANEFAQRPEFRATLDSLTNAQYVDRLIANTGVAFTTAQRDQWVADLNSATKTRAQVLREIVESSVFANNQATINRAFVLAEYFGYLRRDPDPAGFNAWLALLNANPNDFRTMVNGFLNSAEYRSRFGPA